MKTLLSVVELGGIPDYAKIYREAGFELSQVRSMRAALVVIKNSCPDVIAAQFIYSPTYGSQLSNFEALFAAIQCQSPKSKLIAYCHKEDRPHLKIVAARGHVYRDFTYPVDPTVLSACLLELL
ncbi:MAG: hypothetical protein ACC707_08750 [Thiohalomonadales bacterium]